MLGQRGWRGDALTTKLAAEMTEEQLKRAEPVIAAFNEELAQQRRLFDEGKITDQELINGTMDPARAGKIFVDVFARLNRPIPKLQQLGSLEEYRPSWEQDTAKGILEVASDDRSHGDEALAEAARILTKRLIDAGVNLDKKLSDLEIAALEKELDSISKPIRDAMDSPIGDPSAQPAPKPAEPATPTAKEPWEMTLSDFVESPHNKPKGKWVPPPGYHKTLVEQAIREGKPVPPEVLADYPDLAKPVAPSPAPPAPPVAKVGEVKSAATTGDVPSPEQSATKIAAVTEPVPESKPAVKRVSRGMIQRQVFDKETELGGPDILSWITENMPLLSKSNARRIKGKEWWQRNQSLYDDAVTLQRPHHNVIYGGLTGKSFPDQVAQMAYEAGVIKEPSVNVLWAAIDKASKARAKLFEQTRREAKFLEEERAQHEAWLKESKEGEERIDVGNLRVGDTMEVAGERIEVMEIDPDTGDVTLKDGKKFGVQKVSEGQSIYVEKFDSMDLVSDDWPEPEPELKQSPAPAPAPEPTKKIEAIAPNVTVRPLTKAEQNEFQDLSLKARANREKGGPPLTSEETRRYEHLTALAGQLDMLAEDVQSGTKARIQALNEKAAEMDRLRIRTQERAWESKHRRFELLREAAVYQEEATKARTEARRLEKSLSKPTTAQEGEFPGMAGAAPGPSLSPAARPTPTLTPKSQRQIITDLAKGLSVPIRFGRLRTLKFAGYWLRKANLIGSKRANDLPIVSHEVGHKLDTQFSFSGDPSVRAELMNLGDPSLPGSRSSWTPSKSISYRVSEGMAEFVRLWLTDPVSSIRLAPRLQAKFESVLNANKDLGDVLRTAQNDISVWRNAEPQARLHSHISVGENPNATPYTLSQLTRDLVDDLHFLRLAVDDAQRLSKSTLPPTRNPYLAARNLRGSYGMAAEFIRKGVIDWKTKSVTLGTSLEDALKPVSGRLSDFTDWIVAKRAQELHARGKNTGLVNSDVNTTAAKFDSDTAFQEAFRKVKQWNDAILQYAVDSGLVTPEGAVAIRAMNQDYVPLHRVFEVGAGEAPSLESSGLGRGLNVGKPSSLRGLRGSGRDIVNPLETMVKNAYTLVTASEKSAINRMVADLAHQPGMGKWVEQVAIPKDLVRVGLEKIREQLEANGADLTNVPDDLLLQFFQNSRQPRFGENTIKIIRNGEPEFYRLNKDLFDTFHALDLEDSSTLLRLVASPAQLLRAGVTATPDFVLANAIRDTFGAAVLSRYGAFPFHVTFKGVAALLRNPQLVSEWAASGGRSAIEINYFDRIKLQRFLTEKITKDLTPAERALIVIKSPMQALRWLSALSEEATRIGEYQAGYEALRRQGMPEGEARRQAAFEARDRQDFAKGGAKTKILRHAAAFWNAQLQANVRLAQAFKERPVQTTLKGLAFITIPKLLEQAVNWNDDDYWDRPQWERDLFFLVPLGKSKDEHTRFLRIPVPFELGVLFATVPGRFLQWHKENNPEAATSIPKLLAQQTIPNPLPQTLQIAFADFLSGKKGWDIWRGRTVVPESLADLPPEMQWTQQTSLTARKVGKLMGFSPMKIDHLIQGTTGGLGKEITHNVVDRVVSAVTGDERTAQGVVPGSRFITSPSAVASESIEQFYTRLAKLREEKQRRKAEGKSAPEWLSEFERRSRLMAEMNRKMRQATDPVEKSRLAEQRLTTARQTMIQYNKAMRARQKPPVFEETVPWNDTYR